MVKKLKNNSVPTKLLFIENVLIFLKNKMLPTKRARSDENNPFTPKQKHISQTNKI